jgi:hypothetical protein
MVVYGILLNCQVNSFTVSPFHHFFGYVLIIYIMELYGIIWNWVLRLDQSIFVCSDIAWPSITQHAAKEHCVIAHRSSFLLLLKVISIWQY